MQNCLNVADWILTGRRSAEAPSTSAVATAAASKASIAFVATIREDARLKGRSTANDDDQEEAATSPDSAETFQVRHFQAASSSFIPSDLWKFRMWEEVAVFIFIQIGTLCRAVAWRKGRPWEILFTCDLEDFYSVACAWSDRVLRHTDTGDVEELNSKRRHRILLQLVLARICPRFASLKVSLVARKFTLYSWRSYPLIAST